MTDEIPPERRCAMPGCGRLSVYPHQDSLCQRCYPSDDPPEPKPIDQPDPLAEARAIAGDQPVDEAEPSTDWDQVERILQEHRDQQQTEPDPEETSFLAAAMGDDEAAAAYQKEDAAEISTINQPSSIGGASLPTSTLPLGQLDALAPHERRRAARKRGLDWPTTDEARDRLEETIFEIIREGDHRVVDAPTSLGKSYTIASTRWGAREDVTDGRPVVHLLQTRDARDEAIEVAEEHGGKYMVLKARHEACPVAAGDHDPEHVDEDDDRQAITINGEPESVWLKKICDGRGVPFSTAHRYLEDQNDQKTTLPCCSDGECEAITQWERFREGDYPLVIATHNFLFAPGLRLHNHIVLDEEPDFVQDLDTDRVRRAVGAYLREIDAPVQTWEQFIQRAQFDPDTYDAVADEIAAERDQLQEALNQDPDREWYFENSDAHILAPALARAIFNAEGRANDRRVGRTPYEPPRLEANAHDDDMWNREWVSVVLDDSNDIRTVRVVPALGGQDSSSGARSIIGLDAHPALPKWQANTVPWMQKREVLDPTERQLWRRYERGLRVVQVGDATRPLTSGEYFDHEGTRALVEHLREEYDSDFRTAITADAVEGRVKSILAGEAADPKTMHYGEEKSRNDFAAEDIGLVLGCIDPGDDHVLDLLAELDLEAEPERSDPDETDAAHCDHCEGEGCHECDGTGLKRAHGRGFVGDDAETAAAILASVRENHVAQAAGRYARNPDDPDDTATVFVRTDAMPTGFADVQVPGVTWTYSKKQEQVVEVLRDSTTSLTAREISNQTDVSKRHVHRTVERLVEYDVVDAIEGIGPNGATLYAENGLPTTGAVDVTNEDGEVATGLVWDSYTWSVSIADPDGTPEGDGTDTTAETSRSTEVWDWEGTSDGGG